MDGKKDCQCEAEEKLNEMKEDKAPATENDVRNKLADVVEAKAARMFYEEQTTNSVRNAIRSSDFGAIGGIGAQIIIDILDDLSGKVRVSEEEVGFSVQVISKEIVKLMVAEGKIKGAMSQQVMPKIADVITKVLKQRLGGQGAKQEQGLIAGAMGEQ